MGDAVTLEEKRTDGEVGYVLSGYLDEVGNLHVDRHDLGPEVGQFFGSGCSEYESFVTVAAVDLSSLVAAFGEAPDTPALDVLRDDPQRMRVLATVLRSHGIPYSSYSHVG